MKEKTKLYPWQEKTPEAKLCRLADKFGLTIPTMVKYYKSQLSKRKIDTSEETIRKAQALERQWDASAKNRVWNLGGSWNGERLEKAKPKPSRTLAALLEGKSVSAYEND